MNNEPKNYEDWLNLGRVIIPCYKGKPKKGITGYTQEDFKIEKDIWNRDHGTAEIALRLDHDVDLDVDNELIKNLNNGVLDKKFPINWDDYKNCILLVQTEGFNKIDTKVKDIINL